MLTPFHAFVIGCLFRGPASVPEVAAVSYLRSNLVREALIQLRSRGLVREVSGACEIVDRSSAAAAVSLGFTTGASERAAEAT